MKPDSFTWQLQTVLTAYYEDIKGVVSASGCTKSKVVKCKFEDQDDTRLASDADAADASAAAADAADGLTQQPPPPPPRTWEQSHTLRGGASSGPQRWGKERGQQGAGGRRW
jgi:hypothetical protein